MITEITEHPTRDLALGELKYQLCAQNRVYVHSSYFFDYTDQQHKIILCYHE